MGPVEVVVVSCDTNSDLPLQKHRVPRSNGDDGDGDGDDCPPAPQPVLTPNRKLPQGYTKGGEQMTTPLTSDTRWLNQLVR